MRGPVVVHPKGGVAYPVHVESGARHRLGESLPPGCAAVALIADASVAALHAQTVTRALGGGARVEVVTFPPGEQHKSRAVKEALEDELVARGLGRDCVVVALGGGVSTDLAGFVASTYLRGVPWIAMPTSLLAAVDAGVGGKTGVNTPAGKNLIGTFHQPRAVLVDLELMATLPGDEVSNGVAEMVKHGLIADAAYLHELVARAAEVRALRPAALAPLIARSVEIKAAVVAQDPRESDLRQVLNCGHTIAHAVELTSGYAVRHGEAVAAGISVEAGIAQRLGLMPAADVSRLRAALVSLRLPAAPPAGTPARLLQATRTDKKSRAGAARYALPAGIGHMSKGPEGYARHVEDQVVLDALTEVMS